MLSFGNLHKIRTSFLIGLLLQNISKARRYEGQHLFLNAPHHRKYHIFTYFLVLKPRLGCIPQEGLLCHLESFSRYNEKIKLQYFEVQ